MPFTGRGAAQRYSLWPDDGGRTVDGGDVGRSRCREHLLSLALSMCGVTKSFRFGSGGCRAAVRALEGVDLDVSEGELVELLGARGAGKTTLLLCAAGLLSADRGSVCWPAACTAEAKAGYAAYVRATDAPHSFGALSRRLRLLLVDACAPAPAVAWRPFHAWLRELRACGVATILASRVPRGAREKYGGRIVVLSNGRVTRDQLPRSSARVAERDIAERRVAERGALE